MGLSARDVEILIRQLAGWNIVGEGDPENQVEAPVGATFRRKDGTPGATFYVKESGTGDTGWVAK